MSIIWSLCLLMTLSEPVTFSTNEVNTTIEENIELMCVINGCQDNDPISLFKFNGIGFERWISGERVGKDSFLIKLPKGEPMFYYLGTQQQSSKKPIILGPESQINVKGVCQSIRSAKITGSELNVGYDSMTKTIKGLQRDQRSVANTLVQSQKNPEKAERLVQQLAEVDARQLKYLEDLRQAQPFLAKVASLNFYPSYPNNKGDYPNEIAYYASEFFHYIDLEDQSYHRIAPLFEAFKNYAQTLASVGLNEKSVAATISQQLEKVDKTGMAHRYALGGTMVGLQAKNHPAFSGFAKQFIDLYGGDTDSDQIAGLQAQLKQAASFLTGAVAPDFTQRTPEGEEMSLSDFRGKVVLVDFWASWCGPCRRENPNVVRLYDKYKDQGFEVLGVSLDRTKDKWLKAIEKDNLGWSHVSDLKGWKNEVAKMYSVRSIPHTVLVDREGKIIARNLRGDGLERKLASIFGE